ncbi:sigma-70 family RNA polymerase sigma factor [Streptomyces sp. IB201691-2A2]|uniref:sigma-70 family RNA polymerase sigma factor n=1 Tax=Streptomyces sp. IB201691-2A2 TaxID=2561920 RepID=UPI00163DC102|nr:sigma-70 family RNA polymerase sigma factor [Streptomyces sp. IB201691-2A2]
MTAEQVAELERLKPFLEGMVYRAQMPYAVEDLFQEAAVKLVRAWSKPDFVLDRQDGGRAFAYAVMHGVIVDAARANDRNPSSPMDEMPVEISIEPDEGDHVRADRLKSIEKFLKDKLPAKVYEVGRLAIIEGFSQSEIARHLKIDRHTVARRYEKVHTALAPYKDTVHDLLGDVTN